MAFRHRHSPKNDIFGVPKVWLQKHPILGTCECIEREARSSLRRQTQAWQVVAALRIQSHVQYSLFPSQLFSNSIPIHIISNSRHFQPSSCPIQFSSVPILLISNSAHFQELVLNTFETDFEICYLLMDSFLDPFWIQFLICFIFVHPLWVHV